MRLRIVITMIAAVVSLTASAAAQTRIVTGRVLDSLTNEVVTSGQVAVTGTNLSTTIKDDGTFTLAVPTRDVTLSIRSIGFKRRDIAVPVSQGAVNAALDRDFFQLEAIVVTGQATGIERRNLANAVASVGAADLVKTPTASVEQSLMGKVASAQIQDLGGGPGGGVLVTLRGTTSLNNAYTPLYVIDGVITSDAKIARGINRLTRASGGGISSDQEQPIGRVGDLNPSDIESVEVLKGAAASAIYGSKASNGVILITTKKGRAGAPQFNVSQRFGTSKMMRPVGYRIFATQADAIATFGPTAATYWSPTVYNHDDELAGRTPLHFESSGSVTGGTETTRYYGSATVRHEGGIITNTYADKQSLRLNFDQDVGRRIKLSISSEAIHSANNRGITGNGNAGVSYYDGLTTTPSFIELKALCPDGSRQIKCEGGIYPFNPYANSNPLATAALVTNDENVYRMIAAGRLSLDAIQSASHKLQFIVNGGADNFNQKDVVFSPPDLQYESLDGFLGTSVNTFGQGLNANINANIVHAFTPGSGLFNATTSVGIQYETEEQQVSRTMAENLVGGLQITTSGTRVTIDENRSATKNLGFFGQEEVLFRERLLLTAGLRADQSSNNSDASKIYLYPKASASYRIPSPKQGLIEELKVRAALGQSGNQPTYRTKFTELSNTAITGIPAFRVPGTVVSDDIRPERQREIEGGLDATLFGSRVNLETTVYEKRITDLLLRRSLVPVTGYSTQVFNGGTMRTRGFELGVGLVPIQSRKLEWSTHVNFFLSRSLIVDMPVPSFRNGGARYGAIQIEQGKSPTQVIAWAPQPDGTYKEEPIGDYNPDYKLSWSSDVKFAGLRLYWLFDHYQGGWIHNYTELLYDFAGNTKDFAEPTVPGSMLATYGTQKGPARIKAGTTNCSACSWMQPMTSTKLREATLTFELPRSLVNRIWSGARHMRLSASGRNLWTITKYRGGDPEVLVRASTLITQWRSDIWPYPPFRSFWFSLDLGF